MMARRTPLLGDGWETYAGNFLGSESDNLRSYSDDYWDRIERTSNSSREYTHRVHPVNTNGDLMDGRMCSHLAPEFGS